MREVLWGLEGRGSTITKEHGNRGNTPETSVICSPPTSYGDGSALQSQFPSRFQEWLQPQEENRAYGSLLLDISTTLAVSLWKIPFYILQFYDLKLSFPIENASTDFYEHRQKQLQPLFPPKSFKPTVVAM